MSVLRGEAHQALTNYPASAWQDDPREAQMDAEMSADRRLQAVAREGDVECPDQNGA